MLDRITSVRVTDFQTDMRNLGRAARYINDAVRLLKMLLRQAVERNVIAEYPIAKKTKIEKEHPLRLELSPEERRRFFATFDDERAFREHVGRTRKAKGRNPKSDATTKHFLRYRELRESFIVAVETGLRNRTDLRNLLWRDVDFEGGWIRVVMQKTEREAAISISQACRAALRICRSKPVVSEFVFVDAHAHYWSLMRIRRTFALAKQLAGITRRFRDALGIVNALANARILVRDRRIRFAHDTFEEYFVARAIVSRHADGTWVPPAWFSNPRYKRELLELARFIDEMTDENPLHEILAIVRREFVFATPLKHAWRFAETDIDQAMTVDADIQPFLRAIRPTLERAFVQILADPLASHRTVIRGDVVYIKRLPPVMDGQRVMPTLLIAYTVRNRDRVIRLLALSRAADEPLSGANAVDQSHLSILRRIVDVLQDLKGR